jgi:hypothetical protein
VHDDEGVARDTVLRAKSAIASDRADTLQIDRTADDADAIPGVSMTDEGFLEAATQDAGACGLLVGGEFKGVQGPVQAAADQAHVEGAALAARSLMLTS